MDITESSDAVLIEERRRKMLERLQARHLQNPPPINTLRNEAVEPKEVEELQNQAKLLLSDPHATVDLAFLEKIESALSLLPSGFELRRLRDLYAQLRARLQQTKAPTSVFSFKSRQQQKKPADTLSEGKKVAAVVEGATVITRSKDAKTVSNLVSSFNIFL